jgi:low temperature requirement protein LtrA
VLLALNIWLVYVLQSIVLSELNRKSEYYLELTYNIVMLILLSGSLLNYFYRDNQKSLYLFLGALCIVFSEVIDVAYMYISQRALLNFLSTTLSLSAFYFLCKQTNLSDIKEEEIQVVLD